MAYALSISPSPLPLATRFQATLRITSPDINPGDVFLLTPIGTPPVMLNHDMETVPAGAMDPTNLIFESNNGFTLLFGEFDHMTGTSITL